MITSGTDLPIVEHLERISELLNQHPVVLLSSPPGTGKTTVLPPFILRAAGSSSKRIALLEPRRIAAVRTAEFINAQLCSTGYSSDLVGYRVRGESKISAETRLEVQTYGVFNRIAASNIDLAEYGLVILDEAHERSIDIDLALAQVLEIQASLRPDLKILVMSATLNVDDLRSVVPSAPLVTVSAKTYPIEITYLPPSATETRALEDHLVRAVQSVAHRPGDILIFLPGAAEIARASEALAAAFSKREVVQLFGDLSLNEQRSILNPGSEDPPRIIVSSAIAETSLTVPRVHTVIDAGLSRVPRFNPERGMPGLETVRVSSATAEQRAGRAGRLGPGICIRLWPQHEQLVRFRSPEIMESDLAPLLLTLASAGITDLRTLKWMTPPATGALQGAKDLLISLNALDSAGHITEHGVRMQALPVHPRLAQLVITAAERNQTELGCNTAAIWSELKPSAQSAVVDLNSLTLKTAPGSARELSQQLAAIMRRTQVSAVERSTRGSSKISAALLFTAAFPDRVAHQRGDGEYLLSGGSRATLPHGSPLAREEWLVCPAVRMRSGAKNAVISAAAPITLSELQSALPSLFARRNEQIFHQGRKAIIERTIESVGAIEITALERPSTAANVAELLLSNITLSELPLAERTKTFIERAKWLAQIGVIASQVSEWWVRLDEPGLHWLVDFIPGTSRLSDITEQVVHDAVVALAGGAVVSSAIARLAPSSITLPRGRTVTLRYSEERGPVASSRLQDFFGVVTHPTVADGKIPIICELLSPAGRPVQTTNDLPRFWRGSYTEVRKELKSRYPKHDWPEKP